MPQDGAAPRILRAGDRFVTRSPGRDTRHCFSFGVHYDAANVSFGDLVAFNDECLASGGGYTAHQHAGVDLFSWVVRGSLRHEHGGTVSKVEAGGAQLLATGSGAQHSERNTGPDATRFLQVWLQVDPPNSASSSTAGPARYETTISSGTTGWLAVASGVSGAAPILLSNKRAAVYVARLLPDEAEQLPVESWLHLFVVSGLLAVGGHHLSVGDSMRAVAAGGLRVSAMVPTEVLLVSAPPNPQASPMPTPGSAAVMSVSR